MEIAQTLPIKALRASVYLTQTPFTPQVWGGEGLARRFRDLYERGARRPFALVDSAAEADLIVYCEDYQETEHVGAPKLRAEQLVIDHPNRVFVISAEDRPVGFLSGVYVSMPRTRFNDQRFRSGCYFGDINPLIREIENERESCSPRLLFSFIGARTANVRTRLFEQLPTTTDQLVRETGNLQFNVCVDDPEKRSGQNAYLQTILDSKFVLCPRGFGTSSFRLFETMRLGRVPVILSDEWVAPTGPAWSEFAIRIAEKRVVEIPSILRHREAEAAEMGRKARSEWEEWFSPNVYPSRCLEWIHELSLCRTGDEALVFRHWPQMLAASNESGVSSGFCRRWAKRIKAALRSLRSRLRNCLTKH